MDRRDPVTGQFVPTSAPAVERFHASYRHGAPDDCWPWLAGKLGNGYGAFYPDARQVRAHAYAYVLAHGPVPEGHHVHHSCRNRDCCNPAHLVALSAGDHALIDSPAAHNARKTHCMRGHALEGDNLIVQPNSRNPERGPWRNCRVCVNAAKRARRARAKRA